MYNQMSYYLTAPTGYIRPSLRNFYYFDNNSTSLIYDRSVLDRIMDWISCGNPSNILHDFGQMAHDQIQICHHRIAADMLVKPSEIYFTSGATESNNLIIQGVIHYYQKKLRSKSSKVGVVTSSFEHPSVIQLLKHMEKENNLHVAYVEPCSDKNDPEFGTIKVEDVETAINQSPVPIVLVTIMYANNETGAVQNIRRIGKLCHRHKIFFHTDATQGLGKFIMRPKRDHVDAVSFSGHKFHGPKGIGGLYIDAAHHDWYCLCYGGEQEDSKRPGTENVASIVGMTAALELIHTDRGLKNLQMLQKRRFIFDRLSRRTEVIMLGASEDKSLPNTLYLLLKKLGNCNKQLVQELNRRKIYISVGSACQTGHVSHVLSAIKVPKKDWKKVIRISLSDYTSMDECRYLVTNLIKALNKVTSKN